MGEALVLGAFGFASGGVAGWMLVPKAACALLRRAGRRATKWHERIDPGARGSCDWRRCGFVFRQWQKAACSMAGAAVCALLGILCAYGMSACTAFLLLLCAVAMETGVVCDLRARILPLEICALIAVAGVLFQLVVQGVRGVIFGAAYAVVVVIGCFVANRVCSRSDSMAVGGGDVRCMAALSLACGAAAPFGFAVCYACAGAFSLVGLALHYLGASDGVPMAPFLALWLVCGSIASLSI